MVALEKLATFNSNSMQVYRLNDDGKWNDQGTGHVATDYLEKRSKELGLFVIDEEDNETLLLHRISSDDIYGGKRMKSFGVLVISMVMFTLFLAGKVHPQPKECHEPDDLPDCILYIGHVQDAFTKCCAELRAHRDCLCHYSDIDPDMLKVIKACNIPFREGCTSFA